MLILFDIDLTLIRTAGAGMQAMGDAGKELFGPEFDETHTAYAGRLDPLIIRDLIRDNGFEVTPERCSAMRAGYARHLPARLATIEALTLPGVHELLTRLRHTPQVTLGLLTGNFEETGRMKLAAAGIDSTPFVLNVWGDQSPHEPPAREHLPAVALERYRCDCDPSFPADRVTIVGDTVHDVSCGLANGCRVLGVATGYTDMPTLRRAGAHRVVPDLSDTDDVSHWLLHRG